MANTTNWLNISSQSGSSGQTILTLSAQRNLATNYKTATIRAYNPVYNVTAETYVTIEAYSPYIEVAPTIVGVPESGGTYQLSISANCSYVIAYPDLVSSYSTTAATGDTTITFSVSGTYESSTLIGNIVITDESGQVSKTVRVEQYGAGAQISLWPATIYIPATGGTGYFNVSANCPYTATKANGEAWFNVNPESGYTGVTNFTVTAGENTGSTDITGYISINGPGNAGGVIQVVHKAPETRLVVGYYVTSTTEATRILCTNWGQLGKAELGDGTEITLGSGYTFPATGMQYVYYTLTGTNIPQTLFSGCTSVRSASIPNSVTQIDYGAFGGCTGLESISIPDSVTSLSSTCFRNDTSLSSVTFGSGLTQIGSNCFNGCTNLTTVSIPSGVTSIGQLAFSTSSDGPSTFYFYSQTPPTLGFYALTSADLAEIIVPCPYVQAYLSAWSEYAEYISCQDDTQLYFVTDTSNVKGIGETRTITVLNTNINPNDLGLNFPAGSYTVSGNVIYVTYPKNPSSSSTRTWTIGVVGMTTGGTSLSGSYRITQNANAIYSIPYTADTSTVNKSGETRTITIDASNLVASSITIGVGGASGVTTSYNNGVITVTLPYNAGNERNIAVSIIGVTSSGNDAYASVTYSQDGHYTYDIPYTANTTVVADTGETRTITIDTSGLVESSITVSVEGATGVSTSYNNGVITVLFPLNKGAERTIIVNITANTVSNIVANASISYIQNASDSIHYSGDTSTVAASGETRVFTFDVTDLVLSSITASVTGEGVTYSISGDTLTLVFSENTGYSFNNYTIEVSGQTLGGNSAYVVIELVQTCYNRLKIVYGNYESNGYVISSWPSGTKLFGATGAVSSNYSQMIDVSWVESAQIEGGDYFPFRSGFYDFHTNGKVTVIYTLKDGVYRLPEWAFGDCGRVVEATLNDNITLISGYSFYKTSLSSITFSNTFIKIGNYAFEHCHYLSAITFPASMAETIAPSNFGGYAFRDSNLQSITSYSITAPILQSISFTGIRATGTLYYPSGSDYSSWLTLLGSGWTGVPF